MIRELQWEDMNDLIENYYSYYEEVKENPEFGIIFFNSRPSFESEVGWFTNLYRAVLNGDAIVRVAEEDDHVVGICDVARFRPGTELSHTGNLGIAIKEGYRDRGIGRELMQSVIEASKGKLDVLILSVFTTNERAYALYRKLGFVDYGRRPLAIRRGERYFDEILMYLRL
ncbi:MAG: GNAT family N-acetyltransferase [Thermoplasmataceae archaeon]